MFHPLQFFRSNQHCIWPNIRVLLAVTLTDSGGVVSSAMHLCCLCSFGFAFHLHTSCFSTIPTDIIPIKLWKLHLQLLVWITVMRCYVALLLCRTSFLVRNLCSRTLSLQISFCAMCRPFWHIHLGSCIYMHKICPLLQTNCHTFHYVQCVKQQFYGSRTCNYNWWMWRVNLFLE